MNKKQSFQGLISWAKGHYKELFGLFLLLALGLSLQLIGCNETVFSYAPVGSCKDFDIDVLVDGSCSEAPDSTISVICDNNSGQPCSEPSETETTETVCNDPNDPKCQSDPRDYCDRYPEKCRSVVVSPKRNKKSTVPVFTQTVQLGKVDIIFAVDNSSSMEVEHTNIANQFDRFMNDIEDLDYRIAIVTADISSSPGNHNRDYQDGRFVEFDDGSSFLHNDVSSRGEKRKRHEENVKLFKQAIQRPETLDCREDSTACPDDERAICALNMAFEEHHDFFRKDGLLMAIVLSDEDERSSDEVREIYRKRREEGYELEDCDWPQTFYANVLQKISPIKSFSIHAIIIIPGDESCLDEQNEDGGRGYEGKLYEAFVFPPSELKRRFEDNYRKGSVNSICDRNYDDQLGHLASYLSQPDPITLPCEPSHVSVKVDGGDNFVKHEIEGRVLHITERVPINAKLRIQTTCAQVEN